MLIPKNFLKKKALKGTKAAIFVRKELIFLGSINRAGQSAAIQRNIAERNRQLQNERIRRELEERRRAYKKGFIPNPQKLQELRKQNVGIAQRPVGQRPVGQRPVGQRPLNQKPTIVQQKPKKGLLSRILGK